MVCCFTFVSTDSTIMQEYMNIMLNIFSLSFFCVRFRSEISFGLFPFITVVWIVCCCIYVHIVHESHVHHELWNTLFKNMNHPAGLPSKKPVSPPHGGTGSQAAGWAAWSLFITKSIAENRFLQTILTELFHTAVRAQPERLQIYSHSHVCRTKIISAAVTAVTMGMGYEHPQESCSTAATRST